jgi:TonB dependent receptor
VLLAAALAFSQPGKAQSSVPGSNSADIARAALPSPGHVTLSPMATAPAAASIGAPKLAGDAEHGRATVIARRAEFEPWSLSADAEYYFTNNVALASAGELHDTYLRSGAQARYANRIGGDWFVDANLDAHTLLHEEYEMLDFLLLKADASIMHRLSWLADSNLSLGYSGYWISQGDLVTEAFRNHAATLGLQKVWRPVRAMQIIAGLSAEYSVQAEPAPPQRHEYSAYLGYQWRLTDRFSIGTTYRAAYYDYPTYQRQDWNHVVSLGASYSLTDWARLSINASSAWNRSNHDFFNYENLASGISLNLHLQF